MDRDPKDVLQGMLKQNPPHTKDQKKAVTKIANQISGNSENYLTGVLITQSRQLKLRKYTTKQDIANILSCNEPVSLHISRIEFGPFVDKKILVWYDDNTKIPNKLATKLLGLPITGLVFLTCTVSITVEDVESIKNILL